MPRTKINNNIRELTIKDIIVSIKSANNVNSNEYLEVYPQILEFVENCKPSSAKDFVGIAHMTYGWMPKILKNIKLSGVDNDWYKKTFNKIQKGNLTKKDIIDLKGMIDNSVVGVSKFCHFINPEMYAIWDSRVCSKVIKRKAYGQLTNNVDNYISYNDRLNELKNENIDELIRELKKKVNLSGKESNLRILELGLFIK